MSDYSGIPRSYEDDLSRNQDLVVQTGDPDGTPGGSVEEQSARSDGAFGDLWITNIIRSVNWKPRLLGFYIDGRTGYAEFSDVRASGNITAESGTIGGFEIGSDYIRDSGNTMGLASTDSGSKDIRFWAGAAYADRDTAPFRVDENGRVTAIGISTLNKKAYTNFESSGRFITSVGNSGSATFGNQGVTLSTGTTVTGNGGYVRTLWDISNVFTNEPTFSATLYMFSVNSGDARSFIGLGLPTVSGSGIVYSGKSQIGFKVDKTSGVVTVSSEMNDGGSGTSVGTNITTLTTNDTIELFLQATTSAVYWYYRKNGGEITLGDTQTTHIPTGGSQYITFATSNAGSANNFQIVLQCAAYEH